MVEIEGFERGNKVLTFGSHGVKIGKLKEISVNPALHFVVAFEDFEDILPIDAIVLIDQNPGMETFSVAMEKALSIYPLDNLEIAVDGDDCIVYGRYHSLKNSFSVTKSHPLSTMDMEQLKLFADQHDLSIQM